MRRQRIESQSYAGAVIDGVNMANKEYVKCDFEGATLKNMNNVSFKMSNMKNVNFTGETFKDVLMVECDMFQSKINVKNINSMVILDSDMREFTFEQCKIENSSLTCNMKNCQIIDSNFEKCDLSNSDLSASVLKNVHFKKVKMIETIFSGSTLFSVAIDNCNIEKSNFSSSKIEKTSFCKGSNEFSIMKDVEMKDSVFSLKIKLSGLDLSGSKLLDVLFLNVNLNSANLSNVVATGAKIDEIIFPKFSEKMTFIKSEIHYSDLENIDLTSNKFEECDFTGSKLNRCKMMKMDLQKCNFSETEMNGVDLSESNLTETNFYRAKLIKANMTKANLTRANLEFAKLTFSMLNNAILTRANFKSSNLESANLSRVVNEDFINFTESTMNKAILTYGNFTNSKFVSAELFYVNFQNAILVNTNFNYANVYNANFTLADISGISTLNTQNFNTIIRTVQQTNLVQQPTSVSKDIKPNNLPSAFSNLDGVVINENRLPETCYDHIMLDDFNIKETMNEDKDFFIFVFPDDKKDNFDTICMTKDYIKQIISDGNNIFYECTGKFIENTRDKAMTSFGDTPYVNITGVGGARINIPIGDINYILNKPNDRIFYVYFVKEITHTVSWNNRYGKKDFVSANHCQDRSAISIYTIKVCKGDCVLSNPLRNIENIVGNTSENIIGNTSENINEIESLNGDHDNDQNEGMTNDMLAEEEWDLEVMDAMDAMDDNQSDDDTYTGTGYDRNWV